MPTQLLVGPKAPSGKNTIVRGDARPSISLTSPPIAAPHVVRGRDGRQARYARQSGSLSPRSSRAGAVDAGAFTLAVQVADAAIDVAGAAGACQREAGAILAVAE